MAFDNLTMDELINRNADLKKEELKIKALRQEIHDEVKARIIKNNAERKLSRLDDGERAALGLPPKQDVVLTPAPAIIKAEPPPSVVVPEPEPKKKKGLFGIFGG